MKHFWFAGGRDLDPKIWKPWVLWALTAIRKDNPCNGIYTGCAEGADRLVAGMAAKLDLPLHIYEAHGEKHANPWTKKIAAAGEAVDFGMGGRGNWASRVKQRTHRLAKDLNNVVGVKTYLVALPGGRGTQLSIQLAKKYGFGIKIVANPEIPAESGERVPPFIPDWPDAPGLETYPDRYLIDRAQILFHGRNPLAPGSCFQIPDNPAPARFMQGSSIFRTTIPKSYNRIFTCKCGWTQEFGTVMGRCSCWMCQEEYSPLPQWVQDELFVAAMALGDHDADHIAALQMIRRPWAGLSFRAPAPIP
jgi:hypothetical protein